MLLRTAIQTTFRRKNINFHTFTAELIIRPNLLKTHSRTYIAHKHVQTHKCISLPLGNLPPWPESHILRTFADAFGHSRLCALS